MDGRDSERFQKERNLGAGYDVRDRSNVDREKGFEQHCRHGFDRTVGVIEI